MREEGQACSPGLKDQEAAELGSLAPKLRSQGNRVPSTWTYVQWGPHLHPLGAGGSRPEGLSNWSQPLLLQQLSWVGRSL